jgi:hypothetical protein
VIAAQIRPVTVGLAAVAMLRVWIQTVLGYHQDTVVA